MEDFSLIKQKAEDLDYYNFVDNVIYKELPSSKTYNEFKNYIN